MTRVIPLDAIDQLHQIHDELRTIWLAMGNTVDIDDDGYMVPSREALNGTTNRLDDTCKLIEAAKPD
jgi:hypothetical protein